MPYSDRSSESWPARRVAIWPWFAARSTAATPASASAGPSWPTTRRRK
ncbi:Uncharacterised protein [Mycobacteroides abscessus]|nr:Uncharacterised protein [Mycobacteroides abscessus]